MKTRFFYRAAAGLICIVALMAVHAEASAGQLSNGKTTIGNQMPSPDEYTGLSRKVLQYSEAFTQIVGKTKEPGFSDADWEPLEALVDVDNFEREGVFLGAKAELIGWEQYKKYISQYGGATAWEGTLRRITEVPGLVILELEERNTRNGVTDVSNTVTIYQFNDAGKLTHLDVYVMPLP